MLDIFRKKTAPAFEVALQLGASFAGGATELDEIFAGYSEALGIAYQIRDDLDDLAADGAADDGAVRPSLPLALAFERSHSNEALRATLRQAWTGNGRRPGRRRHSGSRVPSNAAAPCSTATRSRPSARSPTSRTPA